MDRRTRPISWTRAALKAFEAFPVEAKIQAARALTIAAEGGPSTAAKPLRGFGPGVFEIALRTRGDAYRVVYAMKVAEAVWVLHAFQKKSTSGIATPRKEWDVVAERLKRLREELS